jgi:hypothetical protein
MTRTKATSTKGKGKAVRARRPAFWLAVAAVGAASLGCLALWARVKRDGRRAAFAELRLLRTRRRLRAARAELQEADEYLAAQGELLDCYEDQFGPLPFNPLAAAADELPGEEWPEELG